MLDVFLDALLDSLKVFGLAFVLYIVLSFIEHKISHLFQRHQKTTPIIGAACGIIPQCGVSVVAADLYHKEHITAGTLMAIFFACSDEALPILMTSERIVYVMPLLLIKFIFGFILGYLVDLIVHQKKLQKIDEEIHVGCCHHPIDSEEETALHRHFIHPLLHSLKIWLYVFIVNFLFGTLIYLIGEDRIFEFLNNNLYLGPVLAGFIGLIPNCASSVILTELFMMNGLSFGALITGLCVNAGLGLIYLLKFKKERKKAFKMMIVLLIYSLVIGYTTLFIMKWMGI